MCDAKVEDWKIPKLNKYVTILFFKLKIILSACMIH